jgi:hypothetical protein
MADHCFQRPGLGEKLARARNDLQPFGSAQSQQRLKIRTSRISPSTSFRGGEDERIMITPKLVENRQLDAYSDSMRAAIDSNQ